MARDINNLLYEIEVIQVDGQPVSVGVQSNPVTEYQAYHVIGLGMAHI